METAYPVNLGIALSGGGARGLAHIGVLKVFEREGIPVQLLTGASMGGIIAAAYATGHTAGEIEDIAAYMSKMRHLIRLLDIDRSRHGLLDQKHVRSFFSDIFGENSTFADLRIPLALTCVDLYRGKEVVLREGRLVDAVLATCAVPGLFPPVSIGDCELVDGGVLNNLPADIARTMGARHVVAVDVAPDLLQDRDTCVDWPRFFPRFGRDLFLAETIMTSTITRARLEAACPDVLIRPALTPNISIFWGFHLAADAIRAGEEAAEKALPALFSLTSSMDGPK